ncbi:MAG: sulfate ABC transporter permease subunit [Chloroflexi bacterium]|nr:sulfate ABC transporter permease subunit [Chloroflexota bacterium]MCC6893693.1 sulfate ABC transporter permease subunit [Anaerolineae bacterium]
MREIRPHKPLHFLILGIALVYVAVLLLAPIVSIIQRALENGFEPVITSLSEPNVIHALQVTFLMTLGAVLLNTVFGIIIAWVLTRQRFRGRRILNILVDIPFVFSPVIAGYTLIVLFGRSGWLTPTTIPIVFALPGVMLAKTFVSLPFVTREVGPVLATLDTEPEQAAYTMGASQWTTFRRIVLPNIWPGIMYGVVLTLARALGEFGAVSVVGGGIEGKTETATMFVFRALNDRNDIGAYSMSLLLGVTAIIVLIVMRLLRRSVVREQAAYVNHSG